MKIIIVISALFLAVAICGPIISDDFTADVIMHEQRNSHKVKLEGQLFEDFTNKRQRIDVEFVKEHPRHIEILRFYSLHEEYELQGTTQCKHDVHFNRTMDAAFAWAKSAKPGHECHGLHHKTGASWIKRHSEYDAVLCVSSHDSTIPLWVEFITHNRNDTRKIEFKSFTSGAPDASVFTVPSVCK